MTDDSSSPAGEKRKAFPSSSGLSSGTNAPPGHGLRRSMTSVDDMATRRRRTPTRRFSSDSNAEAPPRRSSNFSETSLNEARDILNPHNRSNGPSEELSSETSSLANLSLAFALLPAIAGALFHNGQEFVTDCMLILLAGIFLYWSVTQPWIWYHSAQEVRLKQENSNEDVIDDDDSEYETEEADPSSSTVLEDVPEEEDGQERHNSSAAAAEKPLTSQQQSAIKELYTHEILALASCFAMPLISAYLLHYIREQLNRPSNGLVSHSNLTIFLLVAEMRSMSHLIKLVQSRTLHLQRIVHKNPYVSRPPSDNQIVELLGRIEALETSGAVVRDIPEERDDEQDSTKSNQESLVARDVRNAIQPELDALNRAMRRYEKRSTLLQHQTDARFGNVDARLGDAIALAAAAAKNSANSTNFVVRLVDSAVGLMLFPFKAGAQIVMLPLRPFLAFSKRTKGKPPASQATGRPKRASKTVSSARYGGDKVPSRLTKR